jgi:hypothetical protein
MNKDYTVFEIASLWAISVCAARRLFELEPGVVKIPHPGAPHIRKFDRMWVPMSVLERVYARLSEQSEGADEFDGQTMSNEESE